MLPRDGPGTGGLPPLSDGREWSSLLGVTELPREYNQIVGERLGAESGRSLNNVQVKLHLSHSDYGHDQKSTVEVCKDVGLASSDSSESGLGCSGLHPECSGLLLVFHAERRRACEYS